MKATKCFFLLGASALMLCFAACKSTPEPTPAPVETPAAPEEPVQEAPAPAETPAVDEALLAKKQAAENAAAICETAKKTADEARAQTSVPQQYNAALSLQKDAAAAASAEKWDESASLYANAADSYNEAARLSLAKREEALKAIESAKNLQQASAELAQEADKTVPLVDETAEETVSDAEDVPSVQEETK